MHTANYKNILVVTKAKRIRDRDVISPGRLVAFAQVQIKKSETTNKSKRLTAALRKIYGGNAYEN